MGSVTDTSEKGTGLSQPGLSHRTRDRAKTDIRLAACEDNILETVSCDE